MRPKISVIIPVYKVEKYIQHCVDSILNQTLQDIEVILIEDGSPDLCGEICDAYRQQDHRVSVVHKKNSGVSAARNIGLSIASGEYIGFVDADDIVSNCMFEMLYTQAIRLNADICMCSYKKIKTIEEAETLDGNINNIDVIPMNPKETIEAIMDFDRPIQTAVWNKIYKSNVIKNIRFNENKKTAEDLEYLIKAIVESNSIIYIPYKLYGYFIGREEAATSFNHDLNWYLEQNDNIAEVMNVVKDSYRDLANLAISYRCINGELSIINYLVVSDQYNTKIENLIRKDLKNNIYSVFKSGIHIVKKIQILIYIITPKLYRLVLKRKLC